MHRQRLELMVILLKEVEAGTWEPSTDDLGPLPPGMRPTHRFAMVDWLDNVRTDCGFAACAVGHACLDARFNALGLHLQWAGPGQSHGPEYTSKGTTYRTWYAVGAFFDLTPHQADQLFDGDQYPYDLQQSPAAVRERIEAFLNQPT